MDNILIVTSGTGGHVYPGIAVADELKQNNYNPIFVINTLNLTAFNIVKKSNYQYKNLNFASPGIRKLSLSLLLFPFKFIKALFDSNKILDEIKPKIVVGMGAYLEVPVVLVAKLKKIPILLHEQNAVAGVANQFLASFANKIAISFKISQKYFEKEETKVIYTSNPVRKDLFGISRQKAAEKLNLNPNIFTVFVFGGSLGAKKLNSITASAAEFLYNKYKDKIQFIHITGKNNYIETKLIYDKINYKKYITDYMHDIGNAYASCDMVVARAGAGTVKEVELYGLKGIFVPYPYATENHQYLNAQTVSKINFLEVIEEKNLTKEDIINFVDRNINTAINVERTVKPSIFPQEQIFKEIVKLIK